jgi:hypothetical protein
MSVLQLCQHVTEYLKQRVVVEVFVYKRLVSFAYLIPVYLLVVEKAIMLVYDSPKGFEIAHGRVGMVILSNTTN